MKVVGHSNTEKILVQDPRRLHIELSFGGVNDTGH